MTEIVLRIIFETGNSGARLVAEPQGGTVMQTPSAAPAAEQQPEPLSKAQPRLRDLFDRYMAWGRIRGSKDGQHPWSKEHERSVKCRCGWWCDRLSAERADLGTLPLLLVEELSQKVGKVLDGKGRVVPVAGKTRHDYLAALLTWRTWAEKRDLIRIPDPDPLRALRNVSPEPEVEWRGLNPDEFFKLLSVAPIARREKYAVMALTSLRRREFRDLKVKYLDRENKRLVIPPRGNKNGKPSIVPLPPQVFPLVEKRAEGKGPDEDLYVFKVDWLTRMFDRDCEEAGIERKTPEGYAVLHGMRDTASSVLQRLGYGLSLACKFNRHGDERITRKHYTNISAQEVAEAGADLGDHLNVAGLLGIPEPAAPAPAAQPALAQPSAQNVPTGRRDASPRAPEHKPESGVEDFQHGGRGGIRTPCNPPIVILNVLPEYGLANPRGMQGQFAGGLGQGLGELAGVLAGLPSERQGDAVRALVEAARAFASAPPGDVQLTTQLIQIDSAAAAAIRQQSTQGSGAPSSGVAVTTPVAAAVPPIAEVRA